MNRVSSKLIALAALLCIAHGQTPSQVDVTTVTSSTMAPTSTPTPQPPTTQQPTTQPPPFPSDDTFLLMDQDDPKNACLHMEGGLGINVNYTNQINPVKNATVMFDFMKTAMVDKSKSMCSSKNLTATLVLEYIPTKNPYFVTFSFAGVKGADATSGTWNITDVKLEFTFNATDFPGYPDANPKDEDQVMSSSDSPVFDINSNTVALKQVFGCAANRTLDGFTPLAPRMNISLFMTELMVQAFQFTNTSGAFDTNKVSCLADQPYTGNKIVPIAVGAALAGLVIVVLVAYLIGRLRNRKKSSYEALS